MVRFKDRSDAALRLVDPLSHYKSAHPLVLGIPRGGVPMAAIIADALGGELDVVLVRKIRHPQDPELALGAMGEHGAPLWNDPIDWRTLPYGWLREQVQAEHAVLLQRRQAYSPARAALDPHGRNVLVVDDGAATGATLRTALRLIRRTGPKRLVAAAAVAPPDSLRLIRQDCDEAVVLLSPQHFESVGQYFEDFSEVSDGAVFSCLQRAIRRERLRPAA
jgi:predicted phosphoribosyltransferase